MPKIALELHFRVVAQLLPEPCQNAFGAVNRHLFLLTLVTRHLGRPEHAEMSEFEARRIFEAEAAKTVETDMGDPDRGDEKGLRR
jgi:hypothetical protein